MSYLKEGGPLFAGILTSCGMALIRGMESILSEIILGPSYMEALFLSTDVQKMIDVFFLKRGDKGTLHMFPK